MALARRGRGGEQFITEWPPRRSAAATLAADRAHLCGTCGGTDLQTLESGCRAAIVCLGLMAAVDSRMDARRVSDVDGSYRRWRLDQHRAGDADRDGSRPIRLAAQPGACSADCSGSRLRAVRRLG